VSELAFDDPKWMLGLRSGVRLGSIYPVLDLVDQATFKQRRMTAAACPDLPDSHTLNMFIVLF
jgi:hypothetical protein